MEVLIVGAGSMGRWVAESLDARVAFADVDGSAAEAAAEALGGRAVALESEAGERDAFDAVCLAVPMTHVGAAVEAHAPRADRAMLDVTGVMGPALEAMATHAQELERASLHPLFAPERAPGSIAVVRGRSGPVTDRLLADLEACGNDVFETDAATHDEAMESVQAAAHAAVFSFALAAERTPPAFATPVYEALADLAETVTGGTPRVYADIQDTFDGAEAVAEAADAIAAADRDDLEALYREASERWQPRASEDPAATDRGSADEASRETSSDDERP